MKLSSSLVSLLLLVAYAQQIPQFIPETGLGLAGTCVVLERVSIQRGSGDAGTSFLLHVARQDDVRHVLVSPANGVGCLYRLFTFTFCPFCSIRDDSRLAIMDRMKGLAKGGWHPAGDKKISRETWKSDLKGIATGKKQDPYAYAHEHQSAPLSALKDPASFAPPPKHRDYYPNGAPAAVSSPTGTSSPAKSTMPPGPQGGWGSPVPTPSRRREEEEAEANKPKPPPVPYRVDTSGLRTDNLPKPPLRRLEDASTPSPVSARPDTPTRPNTLMTPRSATKPAPILPPRQNEYPDEHTPAPPPSYNEAMARAQAASGLLNKESVNRLGQAGISVPGFGVGSQSPSNPPAANARGPQLGELQQRFARMNTGSDAGNTISQVSSVAMAAAAAKKPPLPPPKKLGLADAVHSAQTGPSQNSAPPPLPLSSKPRPT